MEANKSLRELLLGYPEKKWLFIEPGGNFGDYLIYKGAYRLADQLGCEYQICSYNEFMSMSSFDIDAIYIHGHGGYNFYNQRVPFKILDKAVGLKNFVVVQGPCTVDLNSDVADLLLEILQKSENEETIFYSREFSTFELLNNKCSDTEACLFHDVDTALHLNKEYIESLYGPLKERYDLDVIRRDPEASSLSPYRRSAVQLDPAYYAKSFEHWVRIHSHAKTVVSNRTHSAILSAILGKTVIFFGGVYHKNHSIWNYCLREMGVKWLDEDNLDYFQQPGSFINLIPDRIKNSYKVIRYTNKLKGVPES